MRRSFLSVLFSITCAACSGASTTTATSAEYAGDGSGCDGDTCDTPAGEPVLGDAKGFVDYVAGLDTYDVTTPYDHYIGTDLLWAYAGDDGTQYQQDLADDAWASQQLGQTYAAPAPPPPGAIREAVECSLDNNQPCKSCCEGKLGVGAALVPLCTRKCVDAKTWRGPNKPTPPPPNQPGPDQGIIIPNGTTGYYLYCKLGLKVLSNPLKCQEQADKLCLAWASFARDNCLKIAYGMCTGCIALPKCP